MLDVKVTEVLKHTLRGELAYVPAWRKDPCLIYHPSNCNMQVLHYKPK
jgi:hypothetical protein